MTCRNHDATSGSVFTDQQRNCRCRTETQLPDITTRCGESSRQGRNQHAAAAAGVHADQDRTFRFENPSEPEPHLKAESRCQVDSGKTTDPICTEAWCSFPEGGSDRSRCRLNHGSHSWTAGYGQQLNLQLPGVPGEAPPSAPAARETQQSDQLDSHPCEQQGDNPARKQL